MVEQKKQEELKEKVAQKTQAEEKKKVTEQSKEAQQSDAGKKEPKSKAGQTEQIKKEDKEKSDIKLSKKMQDIISSIENMTVLELSNLVKALEDKFGVTAVQPVIAAAGAQVSGAVAPAEEKSTFTVVLANVGSNKIQVIKEIRGMTTLGLKEAKDLVESAPKTIKEDITKEEAEEIKKKLETAGAKVELK